MKVLITGITGFAGSHLAEYLLCTGKYEVSGTYLYDSSLQNVDKIKNDIELIKIDLSKKKNVSSLIKKVTPSIVFHLAALASPADSFKNPSETLTNNISLQVNLLESIREHNLFETKVIIISSGDIYGIVKNASIPVNEDTPLTPTNPYSVSKIAQDFLGLTYFMSYRLKIIRLRPFNHIGPRQSGRFVVSSFARQIVEIEKKKRKPVLKVGNLNSRRDFTDVRDMVRGYEEIPDKGKFGEVYNIGSGKSYKIHDILEKLISMSSAKIKVEVDKKLYRPNDIPGLVCDYSKFAKATNWKPKISIETTLRNTLDYWRDII